MKNAYVLQKEIYDKRIFNLEIPGWMFVLYGAGEDLSISAISRKYSITYGTVVRTLNTLEDQKLVSWKEIKHKKVYSLTDMGKDLYKLIMPIVKQYFIIKDNQFRKEIVK